MDVFDLVVVFFIAFIISLVFIPVIINVSQKMVFMIMSMNAKFIRAKSADWWTGYFCWIYVFINIPFSI